MQSGPARFVEINESIHLFIYLRTVLAHFNPVSVYYNPDVFLMFIKQQRTKK